MFDLKVISEALQALLLAVLPVIGAVVVAYIKKKKDELESNMTEQQIYNLETVVKIAVLAAEQIYGSGNGEQKKKYAIKVVQQWVSKFGLDIDIELIEASIEKAVLQELNNF